MTCRASICDNDPGSVELGDGSTSEGALRLAQALCPDCAAMVAASVAELLPPEHLADLAGVVNQELTVRAAVAS